MGLLVRNRGSSVKILSLLFGGGGGVQNFVFLWGDLVSSVLEMDRFSMVHFLYELGFCVITRCLVLQF